MRDQRERELFEKLEAHAIRVRSLKEYCENEEQTKITLINPYLEHLGFDVRDPRHVKLEFKSDIGKGTERVDYAIFDGDEAVLLIEAKPANMKLPDEASRQLRRYAMSLPSVNYIAMTNGIDWNWYSKFDSNWHLDDRPFLQHNASDPKEREIQWLISLNYDRGKLDEIAIEENLQSRIFEWFNRQRTNPDSEFINFVKNKGIKESSRSPKITEAIRRIWPKTVNSYIQQEIEKALRRARMSEEDTSETNTIDQSEHTQTPDSSQNKESVSIQTLNGIVTLNTRSKKSAWRIPGSQNWNVEPNMASVCTEILKYFASIHEGGVDDYFQKVSRMSQKGNYLIQKNEIPFGAENSWYSVSSRWVFHTHASNAIKINRIREAAGFCIRNGKSLNFDSEIEIWDPTKPRE